MKKDTVTITVDVDARSAAWTPLDPPPRHPPAVRRLAAAHPRLRRLLSNSGGLVAGGVLVGDPGLCAAIADLLGPWSRVERVRVVQPNVDYEFTAGRDTAADVAAAMLHAGAGRAVLSESSWDALSPAIDALLGDDEDVDADEDEDALVIY